MIDSTFLGSSPVTFNHNPQGAYGDPYAGLSGLFGDDSTATAPSALAGVHPAVAHVLLAVQAARRQQDYQQQQMEMQQQRLGLEQGKYALDLQKQAYDQIPKDQVFTGHDSQTMLQTPDVMDAVNYGVHRYLNQSQAPFMRIGNDLYDGGGQRTTDAALQAANTARAAMTPQDRMANAGAAVWNDPRFSNLDGLQRSQAIMHLTGVDPLSAQDRAQAQLVKQMEFAKNMQGMQAEQRKAMLDEYEGLAKSAGGRPEDILASFGKDASNPNTFTIPATPEEMDKMGGLDKFAGTKRGIDPGTVERMRQLRASLGIGTQPQIDVNALRAREAELLAKAQGGTPQSSSLPAGGLPPFGPLRVFGGDFWRKMGNDIAGNFTSTPSASAPVATYDPTYQRGGPSSVPWWAFGPSR